MTLSYDIWLADLTYTQQQISAELIPAAIGCIATYAEQELGLARPIRLFKYPEAMAAALAADGVPDIIGFSNYVWNFELSSAFARRLKEVAPSTITVLGGPNYPVDAGEQEAFLRAHPEFDFVSFKEGEIAFAELVRALIASGMNKEPVHGAIASIHSIAADGSVHLTETGPRLRDLADIPSPYCTGKLDEFFDGKLLPIIQTNRGCPFSCTFCVEGVQYYNKVARNPTDKIAAELDYIGRKMVESRDKGYRNDLFIADSNFGMYREDIDTCRAIADCQERYGWPDYVSVATGKNQKARVLEAARLVKGAIRLTGAVQSLDEEVMKNIRRSNISSDDLMTLALEAADIDSHSYSEVILALPGDSLAAHFKTLTTVIDAGFTRIGTHVLMLLPGSELGNDDSKRKFGMDVRYRVLPRCFGRFEVLGSPVVAAEIEEVCVGNNTLSFEDYLECRRMNLLIHVFYNEGVFGALLKFLRSLHLSVSRWMDLLYATTPSGRLKELIDAFLEATRTELWTDRDALAAFAQQPGTVESYIKGELGYNIIFTFKALSMTRYVDALQGLAKDTVTRLLEEAGQASPDNLAFVDDLLAYDSARMTGIFDRPDQSVAVTLTHDVERFFTDRAPAPAAHYRLEHPARFEAVLDEGQKRTIRQFIDLYGSDDAGVSRILTKVFVKKLLRTVRPDCQES